MTKEKIISKYKELRETLDRKPNSRDFRAKTGVTQKDLSLAFGRNPYSKLVELSGDKPNRFGMDKSEISDVLSRWGSLTRELGMIPTQYEWEGSGNKPTVSGIARSHNLKWSNIPITFNEQFGSDQKWQDVIKLLPLKSDNVEIETELSQSECFV